MRVSVFGDSIASGQYVNPQDAWVTHLGIALGHEHLVMNAGHSGDTTRMALERMYHDVTAHRPDIMVVQFGLNDCNIWDGQVRVSLESFRANLSEIVSRAKLARVVLVANHRTAKTPDYDQRARVYNRAIRQVADATDAWLVDMEREEVELLDAVHPSPAGHLAYAGAIVPVIEWLLR